MNFDAQLRTHQPGSAPLRPGPSSRYILPNFEERTSYGMKRMDPYTKLFEDRIIFLGVQVDDASANDGRLDQAIAMIVDELGRYGSTRGEAFSAYQAITAVSPQTLIAKIAAAGGGAEP